MPLLRLPEKRDDIATILGYAALLRDGTSDVIFLGTGGSSLGGQTVAQLAGYAVPGVGSLRDPPVSSSHAVGRRQCAVAAEHAQRVTVSLVCAGVPLPMTLLTAYLAPPAPATTVALASAVMVRPWNAPT